MPRVADRARSIVVAFWLREAERLQIWRPLGMVSMLDYVERVLGYAPRTGQDRLRVARALGQLPVVATRERAPPVRTADEPAIRPTWL